MNVTALCAPCVLGVLAVVICDFPCDLRALAVIVAAPCVPCDCPLRFARPRRCDLRLCVSLVICASSLPCVLARPCRRVLRSVVPLVTGRLCWRF